MLPMKQTLHQAKEQKKVNVTTSNTERTRRELYVVIVTRMNNKKI